MKKAESKLCQTTLIKAKVFLGKLLEEQGDVVSSIEAYRSVEEIVPVGSETDLLVKLQILRIQATYKTLKDIEFTYQYCLHSPASTSNLLFEREHALLMAELHIFGVEIAMLRLREALNS